MAREAGKARLAPAQGEGAGLLRRPARGAGRRRSVARGRFPDRLGCAGSGSLSSRHCRGLTRQCHSASNLSMRSRTRRVKPGDDKCHPFSASRRRPTAICISAMRCRRCSMPTWRGGRRAAAAAHRGHRRDALPAGIRGGDLRGPRLARASTGSSRCGGSPSISTTTARRWRNWQAHGPGLSELREPRRDRRAGGGARSNAPWPRDPDGAPLYPGAAQGHVRRRARAPHGAPASLTRCASTWPQRWHAPAR